MEMSDMEMITAPCISKGLQCITSRTLVKGLHGNKVLELDAF